MILYLDTSSLVILYVEEPASADVEGWVGSAAVTATSLIAYAEARAAFSHRFGEHAYSSEDYKRLVSQFESDWKNYMAIHVTAELVRQAGDYAEKHGLRVFSAKTSGLKNPGQLVSKGSCLHLIINPLSLGSTILWQIPTKTSTSIASFLS